MAKKADKTPINTDDYEDILNRSWDEIPEPQTLPVGSYVIRGRNAKFMPPTEKGSAKVLFFYAVRQPMDDVDADALAELGDDYAFEENQVVYTIWVEGARDWAAVRAHLALHGVTGGTVKESLKSFKGTEVVAYLDQRTYTNNAGNVVTENNPTNFAAVE